MPTTVDTVNVQRVRRYNRERVGQHRNVHHLPPGVVQQGTMIDTEGKSIALETIAQTQLLVMRKNKTRGYGAKGKCVKKLFLIFSPHFGRTYDLGEILTLAKHYPE